MVLQEKTAANDDGSSDGARFEVCTMNIPRHQHYTPRQNATANSTQIYGCAGALVDFLLSAASGPLLSGGRRSHGDLLRKPTFFSAGFLGSKAGTHTR